MAQDSPRKRRERRLRRSLSLTRRMLTASLEHRKYLMGQVQTLINVINKGKEEASAGSDRRVLDEPRG